MAAGDMRDDAVGFHAQQAVEKSLKVALVPADVDFPRSLDLVSLVDIATDNEIAVPSSIEQARWLTPWAAQLRYEMLEPLDRDAAFSTASDAVAWGTALLARTRAAVALGRP
jgi:HEPN domain-containing protein